MKIQVGCFLRPANELVRGVNSKSLSALGFTEALLAGATLSDAYRVAEPRLSLSEEEREVLNGLFSSIGECYLDDGVRLIDAAEKRLDALYRKNKTECRKNARLVTVVTVTAAIGFLILVL